MITLQIKGSAHELNVPAARRATSCGSSWRSEKFAFCPIGNAMDLRTAMLKALEKKFREQLQEINAKLARAEDRAKALAQIETTNGLMTREQVDEQLKV